jgi:small subunit ribosomal protein S18
LNQGIAYIDYKKTNNLRKFINRQGRINLRKHTQLTVKNQHRAARAIKTAQEMGLLSRTIVEQTEEPQK